MDESLSCFAESLRDFAAGITTLDTFQRWLVSVLVAEGPRIARHESGELTADFSFASECAMYLDMVTGTDDPNFDEPEARRLAGAFCAIIAQVEDSDLRSAAAHFARWAPKTAAAIREYLGGSVGRAPFERAMSRRPWPEQYRAAVKQLDPERLALLADGLEINDYSKVLRAFA